MRLQSLKISDFKNLKNFEAIFDEKYMTTVLVGPNGTAKSNVLEALILIFREMDLDLPTSFDYEINYSCRNKNIAIISNHSDSRKRFTYKIDGTVIPASVFKKEKKELLPKNLFGYYSGPGDRMETHFKRHQEKFRGALIAKSGNDREEIRKMRTFFYARPIHSHFVLLSFFAEKDNRARSFLKKHLGIMGLDSVLFVMKEPSWKRKDPGGDKRFWNSHGVVKDFLSTLYDLSLAPMKLPLYVPIPDTVKKKTKREHLFLFIKEPEDLSKLSNIYNTKRDFFDDLESTYLSELLKEVRINVKVRNVDGTITFRELSEGEQQLLMVLGLLRFTKDEESIFLLDEPDTHLNPQWSIQYLEFIEDIVGKEPKSQFIMSTHDPLVVSSLEASQILIFQRNDETGAITAFNPEKSPKGMGVAGILKSDIFGMRTTLDKETQDLLDKKRQLAIKNVLNKKEKEELKNISEKLSTLGFSESYRDPLFELFEKQMYLSKEIQSLDKITLTPDEKKKLEILAERAFRTSAEVETRVVEEDYATSLQNVIKKYEKNIDELSNEFKKHKRLTYRGIDGGYFDDIETASLRFSILEDLKLEIKALKEELQNMISSQRKTNCKE